MKLGLAASGGGHVRQILDLEPAWRDHDCFFITEPTALGRSIAKKHRTHYVDHVALGQAKLGAPFRMVYNGVRNAWQSLRCIMRERPDAIITTGAGSMAFAVLWARLSGARIIAIDSFARFDAPSAFARIIGPIATIKLAQAEACGKKWGASHVFDPFKILDGPRPPKRDLLFATVGATLKFERLVDYVALAQAKGLLPAENLVQVGENAPCPDGLTCVESLPFDSIRQTLRDAEITVCHGGTGSLITALQAGCRVIAVPRLFALGEHYDDHQLEITQAFADRGLIEVATTEDEFLAALARYRDDITHGREPMMATTEPAELIAFLKDVLAEWEGQPQRI